MYDHKLLPDMTGIPPDSTISLAQFDPLQEMDILRKVVRRDALVALLVGQRRKFMSGGALCVKIVLNALLEMREASLDVIDAITRWRLTLVKPEAFNVRGMNYAVTMTVDVGFLATGLTPIKEAFGMELGTGNTFALPCAVSSTGDTPTAGIARIAGKGKGYGNGTGGKGSHMIGCTTKYRGKAAAERVPAAVRGDLQNRGKALSSQGQSPAAKESSGNGDPSKVPREEAVSRLTPAARLNKNNKRHNSSNSSPDASTGKAAMTASGDQVPMITPADDLAGLEGLNVGNTGQTRAEPERTEAEGDRASICEVLFMLGEVDAEQRVRLAKAQGFLEEEVARSNGKLKEVLWWGFHRWTARPWVPSDTLSLVGF